MERRSCIENVPAEALNSGADLVRALLNPPYAVICSFGRDTGFTKRLLSSLTPDDEEGAHGLSFTRIHISDAASAGGGMVTRVSRTNAAIPPHTDCSYSPAPHNLVAFEMMQADETGGDSIIVEAERLIGHLDEPTLRMLSLPIFPFGAGRYPIIHVGQYGVQIRYYRAQLEKGLELGYPLPENAHNALGALDKLLERPEMQRKIRLRAGQTLFFANRRILHGRTGFDQGSQRLMHRYRLTIPELELE